MKFKVSKALILAILSSVGYFVGIYFGQSTLGVILGLAVGLAVDYEEGQLSAQDIEAIGSAFAGAILKNAQSQPAQGPQAQDLAGQGVEKQA
jgi:hypothetical protein